jgi:pimeloyl-ACP methyl ester carboxylesterase
MEGVAPRDGALQLDDAPRARDVTCRNVRVRIRERGSGSPVLLIHDFLSDYDEWTDVAGLLAERLRVLSVDLPGFGESEKPRPDRFDYTFDRLAEAMVDVAGALEAAPLSVCGHGVGAAVALALAERHPAMVRRLLLVSPPLFGGRAMAGARAMGLPILGALTFKQLYGRRFFERHFLRHVFASNGPPADRLDRLFDHFSSPAAREAAFAVLEATLDTRTLEARLSRVSAPSLVVWGRKDVLAPAAIGRRLARALPSARLELFDCGHSPPEEMPGRFADAALGFFA